MKGPTSDVFQLPVSLKGFVNLQVSQPKPGDSRTIALVSQRRSATVYRVDDGPESLAVKVINRLKPKDYSRMLWRNTARREFQSACLLKAAGVRVPEPRLWFRNWNVLSRLDSIFVADFVDGLRVGTQYLGPKARQAGDRHIFMEKYGEDLRRMMAAGMLHLDAHPGNVLWSGDARDNLVWLDNDVIQFPSSRRSEWKHKLIEKHRGKVLRDAMLLTLADVEQLEKVL